MVTPPPEAKASSGIRIDCIVIKRPHPEVGQQWYGQNQPDFPWEMDPYRNGVFNAGPDCYSNIAPF